jgi:ATP synthase protein I
LTLTVRRQVWYKEFLRSQAQVKPSDRELYKSVVLFSTVGVAMVIATFIGLMIGVWLDRRAHTAPCFTLLFLLIGVGAGFWNLWKLVQRSIKR